MEGAIVGKIKHRALTAHDEHRVVILVVCVCDWHAVFKLGHDRFVSKDLCVDGVSGIVGVRFHLAAIGACDINIDAVCLKHQIGRRELFEFIARRGLAAVLAMSANDHQHAHGAVHFGVGCGR